MMSMRRFLLVTALILAGPVQAQTPRALPQSREQVQLSFAPVVKRAAPAVVNIFAKRVVRTQQALSPFMNDPFFRQFFGGNNPFGAQPDRVENSLGSGVIVGGDGLIVTNFHVIKDAQEIRVVLADRREFDAKLVSSDERADLAVLRVAATGEALPYLEFRDSDDLEVGDLVLAIGNPFGVGQTVTSGIVSALARTAAGISDFRFFIQTDAAINPGNSGGALITLDGRLVGVNTAIFSQSGGSVGIGFAIPSNMVRTVVGAGSGRRIVRPWIGASGQPVTAEIAGTLSMARPVGVLLKEVYAEGPADRAGLKVGDVVTDVEGHEIDDLEGLRYRIATLPIGGTARLTALRQGRSRQVALALMAPPEAPARDLTQLGGTQPFAGATAGNLSPAFADELGLDGNPRGVILAEIAPNTIAARLGFQKGDVVVKVNDRDIGSVRQLVEATRGTQALWKLAVRRGNQMMNLNVQG